MMKTETREELEISTIGGGGSQIAASFPFAGGLFDQFVGGGGERISSSLGFMELLGIQDFSAGHSLFDLPPQTPVCLPQESSEVLNLPATPNESSISSSSTEAPNEPDPAKGAVTARSALAGDADDDDLDKEKKESSKEGKKKGQKRQRESRIAFLTKSEVDHLEDGYRWRKYGQKAVKNSPFPRSYYRCTTAMCGVKKRLERSSKDATVVITTYEGQHTHRSPVGPRGGQLFYRPPPIADHFGVPPVQLRELHYPFFNSYLPQPTPLPPSQPLDFRHQASVDRRFSNQTVGPSIRDHGLLQDLIPSNIKPKLED